MKRQIAPTAMAQPIRGAFYLLLLATVFAIPFALGQWQTRGQRTLTFAERVAYQRAIEEVYWRHRILPRSRGERPDPKPSLDALMSQAQLEKKVADYLRKSQALEDYWQRPITAEQLQAEMDRMAKNTKQPEVLREIFAALGNDPFLVAECLAKPELSTSLVRDLYAQDQSLHGELKPRAESWQRTAQTQTPNLMAAARANYSLPTISGEAGCIDDSWTATSITEAPAGRASHTAVWTGSEMIVWGGYGGSYFNTGGRYNPSIDSWAAISTINAPTARGGHTAVWTGSEMIVWGGDDGFSLNTGGRYNPANDTWTATTTTNAPLGRIFHTAVWMGNEMIVWGGWNEVEFNTGGKYNPSTDSWTATSTTNAPTARLNHTAVWIGTEMIVWGGWNGTNYFNTGGKYNPSADSWAATSTTNAPTGRYYHTAVWTGNEMIVWGGRNGANYFNTGGKYNPSTDSWAATSTTNAPTGRYYHTAVWTGSDMITWGGTDMLKQFNTGGRYNPGADNWMATTTTNAPERRVGHTAVWSGSEMLVWGGLNDIGPFYLNTGGRYCAQHGATPTPTPTESCFVEHVSLCNSVVFTPPTDFIVEMSCPVDSVQPSGFMVNNIGPNSFTVSKRTITFHYNTSPAVPGLNTIHVLFDAIFCCLRPVSEFTCTFTYVPRPTPIPRPRPTPHPRP
jgi:N-acetylneuraminic acid mutarotase